MKVKALIEKLQELDQEADLIIWEEGDSSGGWKVLEEDDIDTVPS